MMGQRETMGVTGGTLRRMILLLAVAAVIAAMVAATAAPAFAGNRVDGRECVRNVAKDVSGPFATPDTLKEICRVGPPRI
jgi:hypothetical protein